MNYLNKENLYDKMIIKEGKTSMANAHLHEYILFSDGTGITISTLGNEKDHIHYIVDKRVVAELEHRHKIYQDRNGRNS